MKRMNRTLSLLLAVIMILSAAPLTPFSAFLPTANATDETDLNIDFNYAADHGIGSAADALAQKGAGGTTNTGVSTDYYKSNYNKFRWKHVLYDLDPAVYGFPSPGGFSYVNGLTVAANKEGSLRYLLTSEADEDKYIALTCDLSCSYYGNTQWETMKITTDKVLDLNGYKIDMMYGSNRNNKSWYEDHYKQTKHAEYHNKVFITIDEGATLTIIDSSMWRSNGVTNEGTGGILFNAYMVSPHYAEMNYYTTRDLFHVNNGNLVIYGGTFQAGRQKDQLKSNFSWSKLKTCIGAAVSLGISVASYASGINAALATQTDVNDTIMKERAASSENDDGKNPTSTSTTKKDGSGSKTETMASTPDQKANDATGAGRNQTIGEKQASNNEATANKNSNPGTATQKPDDEKNKSNGDNTAKANGSTKGVDYASRLAKAEKGVVDSIVNKSGIEGIVNDAFSFVDSIGTMIGNDETSRVTQSIMGTVVKCGNMGTFVAYGGTFKGYGSTPNTRNAVVEIVRTNNNDNPAVPNRYNGGQAYIYGGTFEGYTGANIFNMVRANTSQTRQMAKRDANTNRVYPVTVTLQESETNNLEQLYFENQLAVAQNNAEPVLINTRNVVVRGGTFRCHYEVMNMGIASSGGAGEGNFVKFPGTPGSVNLGVESYGADFIRDGRIQIVDNYGDGALVLMDEEKDDAGQHTGVYHYRLYCSDEELRYKTYLTVYPNTARTNSTYSMRLETYYGEEEQQDISKAWEIDNDNTRDAAFANDEKYFAFPVDNPWTTNSYYVTPVLEDTDPEGNKLDSSEVWYYSVPMSTRGDPIGSFTYGDVYIVSNNNGVTTRQSARGNIDWIMDEYVASLRKQQGVTFTASLEKHDDYRLNMKWFRYRLYRVDPLTKASISEDPTYGSDKPLAEVVYGTSESEAIRCILNLKDMEQQLLDKKVRLRDGTLWQGYQQGELYRVVFDVEEYLTYGWESATLSDGQLRTATAETSVMFACYGLSEKKPGENHMIEDYTPLQWISEPAVGETASIGILNGFAGKVDYEQNANKIFDVYYQWYLCDEKGNVTENATNLFAGTDNVYKGHKGWTAEQNLAEKRYYTPDKWFDLDGNKIGSWTYKNTIDPNDPDYALLDLTTGMPKNYLEWTAEDLHAYTKELCSRDMKMLAADKSKKVTRENNDVFATNTDACYIPRSLAGKTIRVKCTVVNLKWLAAYDRVQTFWSHPFTIENPDYVVSFVPPEGGSGSMDDVYVEPGTKYTLPANKFYSGVRGQMFAGWKIGSKVYQAGEQITVNSDTVCVATFKTGTALIQFNKGDGTGSMSSLTVNFGDNLPCYECKFTPPTGKTFNYWKITGWNTTQNRDWNLGALWPGEVYNVQTMMDHTFTAMYRWSKISFEANGGTGTMAGYTMKAADNGKYTLPACTFTPPVGKSFDKWNVGAAGETITITGDTVIKPVWRKAVMTFEHGIGSGTMASIQATDKGFILPECTFTPPAGKDFFGYGIYIIENGSRKFVRGGVKPGELISTNGDAIAIAGWYVKPPEYFTITWDAKGGTGTLPPTVQIPNGTVEERTYTFPDLSLDPPEGAYFTGYYWVSQYTGSTTFTYKKKPGETLAIYYDTLIYPLWSSEYVTASFTVGTATADGHLYYPQADAETMPEAQQIKKEIGSVTPPAQNPTAPGYTFAGWDVDFSAVGYTQNFNVKATWTVNDYGVNIVSNEHGTFSQMQVAFTNQKKIAVWNYQYVEKDTAHLDDNVKITATPEEGYVVASVTCVDNAGNIIYTFTGNYFSSAQTEFKFYMPASDVTAYVEFEPMKYRVLVGTPSDDYYGYGIGWEPAYSGASKRLAQSGEVIRIQAWDSYAAYEEQIHESGEKVIHAIPNDQCAFDYVTVTVDGVTTDITQQMQFTMPEKAEPVVTLHFKPTESYYYNIFVGSNCYGSAWTDTPIVGTGDTVELFVEPSPGYRFAKWVARDYYNDSDTLLYYDDESGEDVVVDIVDMLNIQNNRFVFQAEDWPPAELNRISITAVFEPIPELTLSFAAGGGAGAMDAVTVLPGEKCALPECEFLPIGCKEFVGWKIGSRTYQPGEEVTVNAALTATAVWADTEHLVFQGETVTAPTCTKAGLAKLTCVRCGEDLGTTKIPARHDPAEAVLENEKPATATEPASVDVVVYCSVCHQELSRSHKVGDELADLTEIKTDKMHEEGGMLVSMPDVTAGDVAAAGGAGTKILKKDGTELQANEPIGTGMTLQKADGTKMPVAVLGDVDGNGKVETADARFALRRSIGLETYPETSAQYVACDVTRDKKAGTDDARYILRHAIGLKDPKIW